MKNLNLKSLTPQEARKLFKTWNKQQLIEIIDHKDYMWKREQDKNKELEEEVRMYKTESLHLQGIFSMTEKLIKKIPNAV